MRTLGLVLALLGGLIAYLGYQSKMGAAWSAIMGSPIASAPSSAPKVTVPNGTGGKTTLPSNDANGGVGA
jgi:hypothetical protein